MYFFRTFKKSTAPYKVHNMGLLYIIAFYSICRGTAHRYMSQTVMAGQWPLAIIFFTYPGVGGIIAFPSLRPYL